MSASVSTNTLRSKRSRSDGSHSTRMPSTTMIGAGCTSRDLAAAVVLHVVVDRHRHRRAGGERGEVVVEQRPLERVGVVEVERLALGHRAVAEVDVVRVELDEREVAGAGELGQPLGDGRLARRRAAGDADQERPRSAGPRRRSLGSPRDVDCRARGRGCARAAQGLRLRCRLRRAPQTGSAEIAGGQRMTDAPDGPAEGEPERGTRRSPRAGDSGSPVGSTLSIVLAVIAVIAGFLILRAITDDDDDGGGDAITPSTDATTPGTGTATRRLDARPPAARRRRRRRRSRGRGDGRRRQRQRRRRFGGRR